MQDEDDDDDKPKMSKKKMKKLSRLSVAELKQVSWSTVMSHLVYSYLTWFNKISIPAIAQVAAHKEAVGVSRVHVFESGIRKTLLGPI